MEEKMSYPNSPALNSNQQEQGIKKTGFNPDQEPGINYPSMIGKGYEPVEIPRESFYGEGNPGIDRMLLREAPDFIRRRVSEAVQLGDLNKTLTHYEGIIDNGADFFDPDTFTGIKALFAEGKQTARGEAQIAWLKRFTGFLNTLKMEKGK